MIGNWNETRNRLSFKDLLPWMNNFILIPFVHLVVLYNPVLINLCIKLVFFTLAFRVDDLINLEFDG